MYVMYFNPMKFNVLCSMFYVLSCRLQLSAVALQFRAEIIEKKNPAETKHFHSYENKILKSKPNSADSETWRILFLINL